MEQNREPRKRTLHMFSKYFQGWCQEHSMRKGQSVEQTTCENCIYKSQGMKPNSELISYT